MQMLNISNSLAIRKSCRRFEKVEKIPKMHYDSMLWASQQAPYCSGGPRFELYACGDPAKKAELKKACMNQQYVEDAALVFVFCGKDPGTKLRQGFSKFVFDCAAACMCLDLMATALGYGTCWIGNFLPEQVQKILKTDLRPTIILIVGVQEE